MKSRIGSRAEVIGILFVGLCLLLFLVMRKVPLYADDLCRSVQGGDAIGRAIAEYLHWTGRLVTTIATTFVLNGYRTVWSIVNPIAITLLAYGMLLVSGMRKAGAARVFAGTCGVVSFFLLLDQAVARETLYWVTGSITYVWPLVAAIWLVYCWDRSFGTNGVGPSSYAMPWLSCIVGNANEQVAVTAGFIIAIITWANMRKGNRVGRIHVVSGVLFIAGFAALIAAPGNFVRYAQHLDSDAAFYAAPPTLRIGRRVGEILSIMFSGDLKPLFLGLFSAINGVVAWRTKGKRIAVIAAFSAVMAALMFVNVPVPIGTFAWDGTAWDARVVPSLIFWVLSLANIIYAGAYLWKNGGTPVFLLSVIAAVLSQAMTLALPSSPLRLYLLTATCLMVGLVSLAAGLRGRQADMLLAALGAVLLIGSVIRYGHVVSGYGLNAERVRENERVLAERAKDSKTVALRRLSDDRFAFSMPYTPYSEWIAPCFAAYYGLGKNTTIRWEK